MIEYVAEIVHCEWLDLFWEEFASKEVSEMRRTRSAIYVTATETGHISLTTVDATGQQQSFPEATPAELLVQREELNYTPLREKVMRLWEAYPLDGYDRPQKKAELSRLAQEVRESAELLRKFDPLGYFCVTSQLDLYQPQLGAALRSEDIDLMDVGAALLYALEEPALAQLPLRNMFEVAFNGMERATQRDRYELLTKTYAHAEPPVVDRYYPARRRAAGEGDVPLGSSPEYRVVSLDDLHHLLFSLYFAQKKQRIVRCECCWGYFIPPTTRPALYCDRIIDGKSCKQVGPGLRYTVELNRDAALRTYDALRHRMTSRRNRYVDCKAPDGQGNLIFMDYLAYEAWDQNAQTARKAYLANEITAEEFLHRIDIYHDLETYKVDAPCERGKSEWRRRIEADIRFDPYQEYAGMMTLDLGAENPQWELTPAEERIREAHGDSQPLRIRRDD